MRLIADSGSTKTDWRLITKDNTIQQFVTVGINPNYQSEGEIANILKQLDISEMPKELVYYGAGCAADLGKNKITAALKSKFNKTQITVESDMLGACRSLSGTSPGAICILGTGSNACYYDGESIVRKTPSLGYVLGDYGSGNAMGRKLLHDYLGRRMDSESKDLFETTFQESLNEVLSKTYQQKRPAAYLASFAEFIGDHQGRPYFYNLVYTALREFFENDILLLGIKENIPVHFTGSVAYHFSNILRKVGVDLNVHVKNIVQSPIAGLTLFHQYS